MIEEDVLILCAWIWEKYISLSQMDYTDEAQLRKREQQFDIEIP